MKNSIGLEIVARVMQSVDAGEYERYEVFASPFANVRLHAHPALLPLVRSNAYYSQSPSAADVWTVGAVENEHLWEASVTQIKPAWAPVMDCGADGYITDVDHDTRLIMSPVTRTLVVRDRAQRKVYVAGHDARGLFVELFRIVRAVHTATAMMGGAVGLRTSSVSRNGRAVCFVGDEGAGESTALLAAATAHLDGLSILTSDRALVYAHGGLQLLAWPSAIGVGEGSLRALGPRMCSPRSSVTATVG